MPFRVASRAVATLAAVAGMVAGLGAAQSQTPGQRTAYEYALKCWAVAGNIATDPSVRQNPEGVARARGRARRAYDAAMRMGELLGYPQARIADDLDLAARVEGVLLLRDRSYFDRTKAACDQLGLG